MSFAFGFGGDDVEGDDDAQTETGVITSRIAKIQVQDSKPLIPPALHTLPKLLLALPSQISYNLLQIPSIRSADRSEACRESQVGDTNHGGIGSSKVARRSIFDIRAQLMVEADPEENNNESLLEGLDRGDLSSGIYEGGFKTWECALDLASLVADMKVEGGLRVIELGAGSAIPSLTLLQNIARQQGLTQPRRTHFILCDYNEDVLRLATAPNIFLAQHLPALVATNPQSQGDDVEDIDNAKIDYVIESFKAASTEFSFVSGAWGPELVHLIECAISTSDSQQVGVPPRTMILASETIYSPESTKVFVETVMEILRRDPINTKAWVAAKKIYFGVGGGIQDFEHKVTKAGGSLKTLLDMQSAGVGRVVMEVTIPTNE